MKRKQGRPSDFTKETADRICEQIAIGKSLRSIVAMDNMPALATIFKWLRENDSFLKQYEIATQERTEAMAEEMLDIADDGTNDYMTITKGDKKYNVEDREVTNRSKLRVDTRKWLMSKFKPKKFGEKLDVTSDGKPLPAPIYGGKSTTE